MANADRSIRENKALPAQYFPAFNQPAGLGPSACLTAAQHGEQSTSLIPEPNTSLTSRHKLHGLIKEGTHHAAFISSHCQLSKVAAGSVQLCQEDSTRFPSPGHGKQNWKCLRSVRCSSYPVCNAFVFLCCNWRWKKTASPVPQKTGIFVPE